MTKILYVEDDEINAFIMRRSLTGWDVVLARDAETALELVEDELFPVVMLDINLGDSKMTGTQALKILKTKPGYDKVVFVAVTAYAMPNDRERFLNEGFDEYFSKPVNYDKLADYIASVTHREVASS